MERTKIPLDRLVEDFLLDKMARERRKPRTLKTYRPWVQRLAAFVVDQLPWRRRAPRPSRARSPSSRANVYNAAQNTLRGSRCLGESYKFK